MIRGLYNGAAALDVLARKQEIISSNLANVNTSGFRAARLAISQSDFSPAPDSINDLGPEIAEIRLDFKSDGRLSKTDRPLDVSIVGEGFLEFESDSGTLYSRAGQLYRDANTGELMNADRQRVQDAGGGSISIPDNVSDRDIVIASDGTITAKGNQLGQLALVNFANPNDLTLVSQSYFRAGPNMEEVDAEGSFLQFHQEFSNGNAISELVSMIVGTRQYEAVQKATQSISESLREHIRA